MSISTVSSNQSYSHQVAQTQKKQVVDTTYIDRYTVGISSTEGFEPDYKTYINDTLASNSSTKWGFKIDDKGFFGADFNKAAGLPEDMKIHKTLMEHAQNYSKATSGSDPMAVLSKTWNLYKTIAGNTFDPDHTGYMTKEQLKAMPQSYVTKGDFLDGVVSVQKTNDEWIDLIEFNTKITSISNDTMFVSINSFSGDQGNYRLANCRKGYEGCTGTTYEDNLPEDKLATGEIFGRFFFGQVSLILDASYPKVLQGIKNFNSFLESGKDIKSYMSSTQQGKDYLAELSKRLGTKPDGTFDQSLVDTFFDELDKSMKEQLAQVKANSYPQLESKTSKEEDKESKTLKQAYGTSKNTKLPSGSLMNAQA